MPEFILSEDDRPPRVLPKKGLVPAVLAFAEDLGMAVGFGGDKVQRKAVLIFEIAQKMEDGRPFQASKTYTASMWDQSPFYKAACVLLGVDELTKDQVKAFRPRELVGHQCMLNLNHKKKKVGNGMRIDIDAVLPPMEGAPTLAVASTEPPKWVDAQRLKNAADVARFYGGEAPHEGEPEQSAQHDEVPF